MKRDKKPAQLMTLAQAAEVTGLSIGTWRAWILQRRVTFVKMGRRSIRIPESVVEEMIARGTVSATKSTETHH